MAGNSNTRVARTATTFEALPDDYKECIDDYIIHGNKTKAYELTHPSCKNKVSLSSCAKVFFDNKNIIKIVEERKQQLSSVGSMEKYDIIKHIENIAKGIQEDQFSDKTSVKDQLSALQLLCKINGIIDDKPQINNNIQQIFVDDIKE